MICGCANDIGSEEEFPGEEGRIAEEVGTEDLDRYDEENDIFGEGFRSAEFGDLRMSFDNS